jgi:hypothetical protein
MAMAIGLPLAYWVFKLNQDGFSWISLVPGLVAAFFLVGALGMLFTGDESPEQTDGT